ncbi:MAG: thioesterase [Flavobacteriales bacterium]|nr:MAG: thioesterase [Flavobacteriales bacterium]
MEFSPVKLNTYTFFKLPAAFWCGVRVKSISAETCMVKVKLGWFNQNPFKSMYFAVQAMAAEFTTGALVMFHIKASEQNISMLVAQNKAVFTKKATGKISFTCNQGKEIAECIEKAIQTNEGQTIWLTSVGINENGEQVSEMQFQWTIKTRI